jgi:hypothetical protein
MPFLRDMQAFRINAAQFQQRVHMLQPVQPFADDLRP